MGRPLRPIDILCAYDEMSGAAVETVGDAKADKDADGTDGARGT